MTSYRILQKIQKSNLDVDMALVIVSLAQKSGQTAKELPIKGNQDVLMRLMVRRYITRSASQARHKPYVYRLTTDGMQAAKIILDAEVEPATTPQPQTVEESFL